MIMDQGQATFLVWNMSDGSQSHPWQNNAFLSQLIFESCHHMLCELAGVLCL